MTQKAADADAEVTRELRRAGINENIGNINAVNELLATGELMAYTRALKGKGIMLISQGIIMLIKITAVKQHI